MKSQAKKMGRPPLPKKQALAEVFCARLKPDEASAVRKAITASKQDRSSWIRDALLEKARKP